jgi:tetratricopeptide (TPR) repeat protein
LDAAHAPAAELAHHALQAGLTEPAIRFSVAAGDDALQLCAARDAIAQFERALSLIEAGGAAGTNSSVVRHLLAQLGRAYDLNGELGKAQQTYERLLALARQSGDAPNQRLTLNRLAPLTVQASGNIPRAMELLQQALVVAEAAHDLAGLAETE